MKLKALLTLAIAGLCSWQGAWAQDEVVANVTMKEKNSLSNEILAISGIDDVKTVTHLTVTTNPNVQLGDDDWTTLQSMAALQVLDLSQASAEAVPDNLFYNGNGGILATNLVTVKLPKDLKTIGEIAFRGLHHLVTVEVPRTVTTIGTGAFMECENLETCDLSACTLQSIPELCFSYCEKLASFTIPSTVTSIGGYAFNYCKDFTSELPTGLTSIGGYAFYHAAMTDIDVVLPEWAAIGSNMFGETGIRSIVFPTTYYRNLDQFWGCSNLQTITLKSPTLIDEGIDYLYAVDNAADITLRVPKHLVALYKSHPVWSKYKDAVAISPAVDYYVVQKDLNLNNSYMRMDGTPSVDFTSDASLTIAGTAAQTFNNFTAAGKIYPWSSSSNKHTMVLNESADVTVNGDYMQQFFIEMDGYWYFLCLPFDFVVSDVTAESGSFVMRTYDGTRRNAEDADNGNWSSNLTADAEVKAGTGFILQVSEPTTITFKAKAGGTNYVFSKEGDELKTSLQANNANTEASVANTGWNMVGNPWQTFYNIHKMNYTAPFAVISEWNERYDTYSPEDDDYALEPFQALFVQCPNGVTEIGFPSDGRQLTSEVTSQNGARMNVKGSRKLFDIEVSNGERSDKTRLVVNAEATMDYEIGRDAGKFIVGGSHTPQIFSLDAENIKYAINERPADNGTLRLGILFAEDGEHTLQAVRNDIGQVILTDHETGIKTDLQQHAYTFDAEAGLSDSRFTLTLGGAATGISSMETTAQQKDQVYNLNGQRIAYPQKGLYIVNGKKVMKY